MEPNYINIILVQGSNFLQRIIYYSKSIVLLSNCLFTNQITGKLIEYFIMFPTENYIIKRLSFNVCIFIHLWHQRYLSKTAYFQWIGTSLGLLKTLQQVKIAFKVLRLRSSIRKKDISTRRKKLNYAKTIHWGWSVLMETNAPLLTVKLS